MTLSGLVDLFCTEPTLADAIADAADARPLPALDLTSPPPMRPLIAAALAAEHRAGRRRRARAAGHLDLPGGRGPDRSAAVAARAGRGRLLPGLGDPAARAAEPALRHRRPPAGRAAPARRQRRAAAAEGDRGPGPQRAAAAGQGPRRPEAGPAGGRRGHRPRPSWRPPWSAAAYVRVDMVERRGEFAVRGGIVDVFPPTEEHPVRVDFFGDTVEEIHYFSVADQRSSDLALDRGGRLAVPRAAAHRRRTPPRVRR